MVLENGRVVPRIEIGVDDRSPVQYHSNQSALSRNLFTVPVARRVFESLFRGNHIVDGSMILGGFQLPLVTGCSVVEDLDLHSHVSGITLQRRSNADAVVGAFEKTKLES